VLSGFSRAGVALVFASTGVLVGCGSNPYAKCDVDQYSLPILLQLTPHYPPVKVRLMTTLIVAVPVSADLGPLTSSNPRIAKPLPEGVDTEIGGARYRVVTKAPGTAILSAKPLSTRQPPNATWSVALTVQCHVTQGDGTESS
jgi:hypothetical protein